MEHTHTHTHTLHCRKVEKRSRTLFCRCMQSAWYVKNGIQHTHTHTHTFLAMAPSSGCEPASGQADSTFTVRDIHDWTTEQRRRKCDQLAIPVAQDEKPESLRRKLSQFLRQGSPPKTLNHGSESVDPVAPRCGNTRQLTDSQVQHSDRVDVLHPGTHDRTGTPRHQNGGSAREPMVEDHGVPNPLGFDQRPCR